MSSVLDRARAKAAEKAKGAATAAPKEVPHADFVEAYEIVEKSGYGTPVLVGEAARQRCLMTGIAWSGAALSGTGQLGELTCKTVDDLVEIAAGVLEEQGGAAAAPAEPAAQAAPVGAAEVAAAGAAPPVTALPPDAPASDPALASAGADGKDPTKRTRGRPKKADAAAASAQAAAADAAATAAPTGVALYADGGVALFVDCAPDSPHQRLEPWVAGVVSGIVAEARANGWDCPDVRACEEKPLAFGGWRGVVHARVTEAFAGLPPGLYALDASGSDFGAIAAAALRPLVALYVSGGRR